MKNKCLQLQKTVFMIEKDIIALMGQLSNAGVVYYSNSEGGPPYTRNKRKLTVLEGDCT